MNSILTVLATFMICAGMSAAPIFGQTLSRSAQDAAFDVTEVQLHCKTMWLEPLVVNNQQAFAKAFAQQQAKGCDIDRKLEIDFQRYTFVALTKMADCQAMVNVRVTKNESEKIYLIAVESRYGGCRGLTPHNLAWRQSSQLISLSGS
jgi:hypothetical protein